MRVLFFSPFSYFQPHSLPERILAESLMREGADVTILNCDGVFKDLCLCMPLDSFNNQEKRLSICKQCMRNRDAYKSEFNLKTAVIGDYLQQSDYVEIKRQMQDISTLNFLDYKYEGVPIGKYALYEFLLSYKLNSPVIPQKLWEQFQVQIKNALIAAIAAKNFLTELNPDIVIFYNTLYSVNRVVAAQAEKNGIEHYMIQAGAHLRYRTNQLLVTKGLTFYFNKSPHLSDFRKKYMSKKEVIYVNEHIAELFAAVSPWVYSTRSERIDSENIRIKLGITGNQKIALAVMRSNDERIGAGFAGQAGLEGEPIFSSQFEWLNWLSIFCEKNPDVFVIFRIHPREFPNKRESVLSTAATEFLSFIEKTILPNNLYINLPSDNFSLHDLLKVTNLMLNNSSSAGLEANLFGIPVLGNRDALYSFDQILQVEPESIEHYEQLLREMLENKKDFARVIAAYRWLNFLLSEVSIDISDGYAPKVRGKKSALFLIARLLRRLGLPYPDFAITGQVKSRTQPVKEHDRLVFAIMNKRDAHVGVFPSTTLGDQKSEFKEISKFMNEIYSGISSSADGAFRKSVREMIKSHESKIHG
jgi:hypothetical protein